MAWNGSVRLVVASEWLAEQLVADGLSRDDMTVVPPGRDVVGNGGWRPSNAELRRGRRVALLCVANWLPHKGVLELLDAFAALPAPLATLHLVGDEAVAPAYRRRVLERLGRPDLADRVVRHGIVAPESMGGIYEAADVFCWRARSSPTAPCTARRWPPTAALAELAGDDPLRLRLGEAAAARAEQLPTWAETAERFYAVCRAAAASPTAGPRARRPA